jgi:hypothetical protein
MLTSLSLSSYNGPGNFGKGFSIMAQSKYLNIAHSAVSLTIRQAEESRLKPHFVNLLLALRPEKT